MTTSRMLARTVLPPALALGLVALVVHPLEALAAPTAAPAPAAAPAAMLAYNAALEGPTGSAVTTAVPAVAFQQRATLAGGRLRTAVLVNVAEPGGTASVAGAPGCSATAVPGVPTWIDCAYGGPAATVTVHVTLSDGRVFADSELPVVRS